ncbi:hypothetical protein AEAC466_12495 [Asticcacaulis sp. AC466]|uniref:hypothetical protein n=1 Tax=Asticcacaulis sp. AC466 TaxID=1282362 RepID=UPI0003C3F141|nr:hypothetical protein [Asticcacaulis sp. AC466]ESQ83488.1 hypothetical protein AEAC466_12495 [Asticcacaulis sp. AC466]
MAVTLALCSSGLCVAAPAVAEPPVSSSGTAIAIMQATSAMQAGDCEGALAPLNQLWHDPYLEQNDPALAAQVRFQLIGCTLQTRGIAEALALSTENVSRARDINAYDVHVFLQLLNDQPDAAAATLEAGMAKYPEQGPNLTDVSVIGVLLHFHEDQPARTLALMNRLEEVHWQIHNISGRPLIGLLRLEGLRASVKSGDALHAELYRAGLKTDSLFYVLSQGDADISAADVAAAPVGPVIAREIDDVKRVVAGNPADLFSLSYLMTLEQVNNQNSLALTQLEGILALVDQYGLDKFGSPETYPELLTTRAELLANVGRYGDSGVAYEDGAKKLGAEKASHLMLSYMNFLIDRGQEKTALGLIPRIDQKGLDDDGKVMLVMNDACAQGYMGDKAAFANDMKVLEGSGLVQVKPYLCAGDTESAARALITAINDPDSRDQVIAFLQLGLPGLSYSERDAKLVASMRALKQRPDVQAAAKANRILIRSWDIRLN